MKKHLFITIILLSNTLAFAQYELKGTMGIYFASIPSMQDYVNQSGLASSNNQLESFVSSVVFAGEGGLFLSKSFEMALEVAYQLYSFTDVKPEGKDELSFNNLMPSLLGYYVLNGDGYNFKFGGGAGVRFVSVDETRNISVAKTNYSSLGFGIILRIEGNTLLGSSVYANIGADIRYDVNGEPDNNGTPLNNNLQNVNFNAFSVGVRLGITYIIGGND
ncbi:MAG: hypothetical protein E2O46_03585 [Ignavibacteria bacterium]|nr:MAG: hypothetical protein E2O46_03585 [Ignavibacteria bacterium]